MRDQTAGLGDVVQAVEGAGSRISSVMTLAMPTGGAGSRAAPRDDRARVQGLRREGCRSRRACRAVTAPNQIITARLREAADLLEPQAANPERVRAYREAAQTVSNQEGSVRPLTLFGSARHGWPTSC